jgi:hypothetical protein
VRKYFIVRVSRLCAGPFPGLTGGDRVKLVDPEAGPCLPLVKQRELGRAGSGRCPLRKLAPERLLSEKSTYYLYSSHYTHLVKSTGAFIRL